MSSEIRPERETGSGSGDESRHDAAASQSPDPPQTLPSLDAGNAAPAGSRGISRSGRRTSIMFAIGIPIGLLACFLGQNLPTSFVIGWACACIFYLVRVWSRIARFTGERTREHAQGEDPSRTTADIVIMISSVVSIVALVVMMSIGGSSQERTLPIAALTLSSILLTWGLIHTLYTLRYAEMYYSGSDPCIDFPGTKLPQYTDFAYLAFTMGMTFQVSDTDLTSTNVRRVALGHTLLSYLFNTLLIGATVNLLAGVMS
ncbi:DUF1345 domain-containing protein [Bifidobacterium sp.]|uniref:DUF1345 domain-containing protein n=1 Tax=Bifidobacterium sp. TaxID=41200 RepID=UPI0039EB75B4